MTKSVEIKVTREDARTTIVEILQECEKIRTEYVHALNDFYAPLEPLEEEYKRQIHRLLSVAKEDSGIGRELIRMDALYQADDVQKTDLFKKYFNGNETAQLNLKFPRMLELNPAKKLEVMFDFFNAVHYDNTSKISSPLVSMFVRDKGITSFWGDDHNAWIYRVDIGDRRLFIPEAEYVSRSYFWTGKKYGPVFEQELSSGNDSLFILLPSSILVENAVKVRTVPEILFLKAQNQEKYWSEHPFTVELSSLHRIIGSPLFTEPAAAASNSNNYLHVCCPAEYSVMTHSRGEMNSDTIARIEKIVEILCKRDK